MTRVYGAGWTENPRALELHGDLTASLETHSARLTGGSLATWKGAALKAVEAAHYKDTVDIRRGAPSLSVPDIPYAPGTRHGIESAAKMHSSYADYLRASKLGSKGENSRNAVGLPSKIEQFRRPVGSGGLYSGVPLGDTFPERPIKDASDLEKEWPLQEANAIIFNAGGTDGPTEDFSGPAYVTHPLKGSESSIRLFKK
jgi:hypothetical protein